MSVLHIYPCLTKYDFANIVCLKDGTYRHGRRCPSSWMVPECVAAAWLPSAVLILDCVRGVKGPTKRLLSGDMLRLAPLSSMIGKDGEFERPAVQA